jgi:hypothetical protein
MNHLFYGFLAGSVKQQAHKTPEGGLEAAQRQPLEGRWWDSLQHFGHPQQHLHYKQQEHLGASAVTFSLFVKVS